MEVHNKTLFLKSEKIGEGELGSMLMTGFLNTMLEQETLPKEIICVNSAVLLTTADQTSQIIQILKALDAKGVDIYSCGTCLDYFDKREDLKIGVVGNAIDTVKTLLSKDTVCL
jgi:selenium metabolism protein YedF